MEAEDWWWEVEAFGDVYRVCRQRGEEGLR